MLPIAYFFFICVIKLLFKWFRCTEPTWLTILSECECLATENVRKLLCIFCILSDSDESDTETQDQNLTKCSLCGHARRNKNRVEDLSKVRLLRTTALSSLHLTIPLMGGAGKGQQLYNISYS